MTLVSDGRLTLETPVLPLLPELRGPAEKAKIRLRHLLGHASGLPAHIHFYEQIRAGERAGTDTVRDALATMAARTPLAYQVGSQTIYSDLGYILLARLIENLTAQRLDTVFSERVAGPPRHDDNCHAGGGISGHAGLFTTASDLARLALTLCRAYSGTQDFVSSEVLRSFWSTAGAGATSFRMGWDTPSEVPGVSHAGDHWPASGVGHLGYTGTAWWLAPRAGRVVIILTNRVYHSCEKDGIKALRRACMQAIVGALPPL